ncbi:hypothetical protein OE88DRAFT_4188 [Heliocybe sulcata]|uniref:Uncharacterized protein n=1 Tax=Heliocybe sulcata TaxID=5364 RepID=A0A5C3NJP4_9AGAM|nr:hypothetical protein OE88DRAFT_4188 [Heliocybe sulcata]
MFLPLDHPRQMNGVPTDFRPLSVPGLERARSDTDPDDLLLRAAPCKGAIHPNLLRTENVMYESTSASASAQPGPVPFEAGASLKFKFCKQSGAMLAFKAPAERFDVGRRTKVFEKRLISDYKSWTRFTIDLGYSIGSGDLQVVTGLARTSQWSMAAYKSSSSDFSAEAYFSVPSVASASVSHNSHWRSPDRAVLYNCGPSKPTDEADQTLFIRTICVRPRRLFPTKLRASAGAHRLEDADDSDADCGSGVSIESTDRQVTIVKVPQYEEDANILSPILVYILKACPEAEVALARYSDVIPYLGVSESSL